MIHVAVSDAEVVAGEREVRCSADVETDVEFGDLDDAFLAGHAVADDVQIAEV